LIGDGWHDVVHPDDLPETVRNGGVSPRRAKITRSDYRPEAARRLLPLAQGQSNCGRDPEGNIVKWFGTNTDIDDQEDNRRKT
jgi:hypothetical protein